MGKKAPNCATGVRVSAGARRLRMEPVRAERLAALEREATRWLWYVLEVAPGREFLAQRLLGGRGVVAFCPTRVVWRRPNGQTRRKREVVLPALPRFVMVGVDSEEALHAAARGVPHISGVIGVGGRPRPVGREGLLWMARRSSEAPAVERFMHTRAEFAVGDRVRVIDGALRGVEAVVLSLDGARARVLAPLFGGEVAGECGISALVAVNG